MTEATDSSGDIVMNVRKMSPTAIRAYPARFKAQVLRMKALCCGSMVLAILTYSPAAFQSQPAVSSGDSSRLYIVLLKTPSVVEQIVESTADQPVRARRSMLRGPAAQDYQSTIERQQLDLIRSIARLSESIEVLAHRSFLINVLIVRGPPQEVEQLLGLKQVAGIYPKEQRFLLMDKVPEVIGAPAAWSAIEAIWGEQPGAGIKIAIVDSGINVDHPMFDGEGFSLPSGNTLYPLGNPAFTNNKVIVARSFTTKEYGMQADDEIPDEDAEHGSMVAAVAAGRPAAAPDPPALLQGVAPMAYLGNYKVFDGSQVTTNLAVIAAMDAAVEDGMDIINLSLGEDIRGPVTEPERRAIANAIQAGVVVVAAAGNAGPDGGTIGVPASSPDVITVGATSNGRVFASPLEIASESSTPPDDIKRIAYIPGDKILIDKPVEPFPIVSIKPWDPSELACSPLPAGSLEGKVALVKRGTCTFSQKAANILDFAGAEAMVVYNNEACSLIIMAWDETPDKPAVMIDKSSGESLAAYLQSERGADATVLIRARSERAASSADSNCIAAFSSRGPNFDFAIKPDLVAPGENIYTASKNGADYKVNINGTSFSAPVVSGAAALIRQFHPEWEQLSPELMAKAIKSALVNTAAKTTTWGGQPARVIHTGNGRLDLKAALQASAMLDPVSVSFGVIDEAGAQFPESTMELTNLDSAVRDYNIEFVSAFENPSVTLFASPSSFNLPPGDSQTIAFTAQPAAAPQSGVFEGYVRITSSDDSMLTAAYWGAVSIEDDSVLLQVSKTAGSPFTELEDALRAASPGNIIEIADSQTYQTSIRLALNDGGLPLHGLTLRSKPGESPIVSSTGLPAITVTDLERVTIEGLQIISSADAIQFLNSDGLILNNVIQRGSTGSGDGIFLDDSSAHIFGNAIEGARASGIRLFSSSALIQQNRIDGSTASPSDTQQGVSASLRSRLALFDNEITNNGSSGVDLSNSSALVSGNVIRSHQGAPGHGIRLQGGTVADYLVQDNLIEQNKGAGIRIEDTRATLRRNHIEANLSSGLSLTGSPSTDAQSLFLLRNGQGIESRFSDLKLANSVVAGSDDPQSGHGISAHGSTLEIANSTITGNSQMGIQLSSSSGKIINSIFFQNSQGDISPGASITQTGNLTGVNPLFTDLEGFDFSLRPESPAIDKGVEDASVGSLDLYSHQRTVGSAVDQGALEFGSPYSTPLILPVLNGTGDEGFLGLAMVNAFHDPSQVLLKGRDLAGQAWRDGQGQEIEAPLMDVEAESQATLLIPGSELGLARPGWIEILSTRPDLMSFTLLGSFASSTINAMDGAQLPPALFSKLLFPEVRNSGAESTRFFIVNPGPKSSSTTVTLEWVRPSGLPIKQNLAVPAGGMIEKSFSEIFGPGSDGYVTATASDGSLLYGMEIFESGQSRGGLLALDWEAAASQLAGAQLASSSAVETTLNVINTGAAAAVIFDALDEAGQKIDSVTRDLPQGGQLRIEARELFDFPEGAVVGWVRIRSTIGTLTGSLSFGDPQSRVLASLPLQRDGSREFVLSHVAETDQLFTGVTLLNTNSTDAVITLEVFNVQKQLAGIAFLKLGPSEKEARLLRQLISALPDQEGGFIRVRSSVPIFGFEIFGDYAGNFLSAVPQQVVLQ